MASIKLRYMAAAALAAIAISSCEEEDLNIGNSLTHESDKLIVSAQTYPISTRTIVADSVLSLSADCYFGRVRDPQTGTDITSEFTTQFHILENMYISPEDRIVGRYNGRAAADSCDLVLYIASPFRSADSLTAMKMRASELAWPMEEGRRYYSNFSPAKMGMVRNGGISKSVVFSYANLGETDSARSSSTYQACIRISLNQPYTAPDGTTYKNYGTYLMLQYYDHKENFANSYVFTHTICPGFLFEITDGLGFHSKVTDIGLRTFYTIQSDTVQYSAGLILAGTKEVLQTTYVQNDTETLKAMAAETDYTYIKTPAGLFTEVTIPVDDIKTGHEGDSLIAAKLTFQRLNNETDDSRALPAPTALLLVQKDSLKTFFENNRLPDNITSYYAVYNYSNASTATRNNTYTFNNLSSLVTTLWQTKQRGVKANPNWVAEHPDWNKMVLVPVTYTTTSSTSTTLASMHHDMAITSTRLVGGATNRHDPLTISIVYAKFK
ncbi:MAG: DUF4270 domain-containing protein [Prevotella sp.]|nr:DUF4270 domain-containing protein [Prevotella sp.]